MNKILLSSAMLLAVSLQVYADVKMHGLFGDHMVLQSDIKIPVWGWAEPGEAVTVSLGDTSAKTIAGADGKWRVDLARTPATAEPQVLTITGKNSLKFEDVLVGEVWLCSGQSNMEYGIFNVARKEMVLDSQIRTFCVDKAASLTPLENTYSIPEGYGVDSGFGHWQKEDPAGPWGGFSAVGYLFAKEIRKVTNKPVGMIGSYWGGTPARAWTSLSAIEKEPRFAKCMEDLHSTPPELEKTFPVQWGAYVIAQKKWRMESFDPYQQRKKEWQAAVKKAKQEGQPLPPEPELETPAPPSPSWQGGKTTALFNGMIHPLMPFAIKGAIWYQGEANVGDDTYDLLFKTMITDWRTRWGQGDFPFLFVQLAAYSNGTKGDWAALREMQRQALGLPNTGMAVAIDVGEPKDIHPKNKFTVAQRLALAAQHVAYGKKDIPFSGPTFESMNAEGKSLRISFGNTGDGLSIAAAPAMPGAMALPAPEALRGFEIAGADKTWFAAKALIDGASVVVSSDQVASPVAVRYAWSDAPLCDLYNKDGLPAVPFRTDDWNSNAAFSCTETNK